MNFFKKKLKKEIVEDKEVKLTEELKDLYEKNIKITEELESLKKDNNKILNNTKKTYKEKNQEIRDLKASYMKELNKNIINCADIKQLEEDVKQKDIAIEILTNDLRVYIKYVDEYNKKGDI
jgi:hypothetical protein